MKRPFPTQCSLELEVYATRDAMGKAAAQDAVAVVKETINKNGKAVIVFAAAPSQNEFLAHLAKERGIDWAKVICFHLDEYRPSPKSSQYRPRSPEGRCREKNVGGPITSACPSSALRRHRFVRIYLDRDSAALLR
jgi:6-phosphogluconolactonase/glucosamine-6-phosphate isomerase/deaminase